MVIKQPPKFDLAESMTRDLEKEIAYTLLHGAGTSTASAEPPKPLSINDVIEAARTLRETKNNTPEQIVVLSGPWLAMPEKMLKAMFGERSLFITERELDALKKECKPFAQTEDSSSDTLMRSYGLPIVYADDARRVMFSPSKNFRWR